MLNCGSRRITSRRLNARLALAIAAAAPFAAQAYSGTPYTGTPIALPGSFQADNFDKGGQGVAYNDLSAGNLGGQYRTSEDVDIYASTDTTGGPYQVANFQTGEWMAYTVNVAKSANYDLSIHVANNYNSSDAYHIEVDGVNVTGSVPVPVTGSWSTYQWVAKPSVPLTAGQHVLKLVADSQWFNVNAISVATSATQPTSTTTSGGTTSTGSTSTGSTSTSTSTGYKGTPYTGTPIALPVMFYADNFDKGGQGIAYNDLTAGNLGGQYRTTEDVDLYTSTDTTGGPYQVANFQTGEWMNYTVKVPTSGTYALSIYAANNYSSSDAYHIEIDGVNVTGSVPIPMTGSWTTYQWVNAPSVSLSSGTHVLKLVADSQWFNVSAINVQSVGYAGTPYAGTPIALPSLFYADNFDKGGQGVAYNDLTTGNLGGLYRTSEDVDIYTSTDTTGGPYQVANFQTGEWMNYTVNVPSAGNYDFSIYASTNDSTDRPAFHIAIDGTSVTGSIPVPLTGSWGTYQWVGVQKVPLTAGQHVLRLVADAQWFNVSAISVLASGTTTTSTGGTTTTSSTGGTTSTSGSTTTTSGSTTTTSGSTSTATPPQSLLFWSGFEPAMQLNPIQSGDCYSNGCWQYLSGIDGNTGYNWAGTVWGGVPSFQMIENSGTSATTSNIGNYITNQIQTMTGHNGNSTNALVQTILQSGCNGGSTSCGTGSQGSGSTQDPMMIQPSSEVGEAYISMWMMLPTDLVTNVMSSPTWFNLVEWKTVDPFDYRLLFYLTNYSGGAPVWTLNLDDDFGNQFYRAYNSSVPVPLGKWFKIEAYWKRSTDPTVGRFWFAVDGQQIFNWYGSNVVSSPINRVMVNQLYSGGNYPISHAIDDLQIWSTFPSASPGDPWYNAPYAPH